MAGSGILHEELCLGGTIIADSGRANQDRMSTSQSIDKLLSTAYTGIPEDALACVCPAWLIDRLAGEVNKYVRGGDGGACSGGEGRGLCVVAEDCKGGMGGVVEEGFCGGGVAGEEGDLGVEKAELMDECAAYETCAACEEDVAVREGRTEGRVEEGGCGSRGVRGGAGDCCDGEGIGARGAAGGARTAWGRPGGGGGEGEGRGDGDEGSHCWCG